MKYPRWFCPVVLCTYNTTYKKNIRIHLKEVHNWVNSDIKKELDKFHTAFKKNLDSVNPDTPSYVH